MDPIFILLLNADGFLALTLMAALLNLRLMPTLGASLTTTHDQPHLSILIPARNEGHNLGRSLAAALEQSYSEFEVLVLDDQSTDDTLALARTFAAGHPRLRVLEGESRPAGWAGKNWACQQLAREAQGKLLLFVDADVVMSETAASRAVHHLQQGKLGLLSVLPRLRLDSWLERLALPLIAWGSLALVPEPLLRLVRWPAAALAIGQFMLFRREAYDDSGGHEAVRAHVTEDFELARRTKIGGHAIGYAVAGGQVSTRMYRGAGSVWRGLTRSLYGVFPGGLSMHLLLWLIIAVAFLLPPLLLLGGALGASISPATLWLAAAGVALSLGGWWAVLAKADLPSGVALLYPIIVLSGTTIALASPVMHWRGRVQWKGRSLRSAGEGRG